LPSLEESRPYLSRRLKRTGNRANVGLSCRGRANARTHRGAAPSAPGVDAGADNSSAAYNGFWKPLEPALAGVKRVYVSPDGVLNQIPFGLFTDSGGKLIIEKYELRYVNSTKDLLRQTRSAQTRSAVLVGNPKFDLSEAEQRGTR